MHLNVKNHEAHRLAAEIARRTGETMTEAVTASLRERLERLGSEQSVEARIAEAKEISRSFLDELQRGGLTPADIQDESWLYDEDGAPR